MSNNDDIKKRFPVYTADGIYLYYWDADRGTSWEAGVVEEPIPGVQTREQLAAYHAENSRLRQAYEAFRNDTTDSDLGYLSAAYLARKLDAAMRGGSDE